MKDYCRVCNGLFGGPATCSRCFVNAKLASSEIHIMELQSKLAILRFQFDNQHSDKSRTPDLKIVVQDERDGFEYTQKHILCEKSRVFREMLDESNMSEETEMVCIKDASLPAMRAVVKFCYVGEITFDGEVSAEDLLEVADKYEILELYKKCEEDLVQTLTHGNLLERLILAKKFDATLLKNAATDYLHLHYL